MGSGASHEDVINSKWWEIEAQQMLKTTNTDKIKVICSLIPLKDEKAALGLLKARWDLETLFTLYCRYQDLCKEQHEDPSKLTPDFKANELWRVFRMPLGSGECPWDWNWQPPHSGAASKIADEFYAAVCRALLRIPLSDFVKWALGYDALFVKSLFGAVCEVRDNLQKVLRDCPEIRHIYIKVEKILKSRHLKLAHWIIASSLSNSQYPLQVALASMQDPLRNLFATRNLDRILECLPTIDQRLEHINQKYNWDKWSADLDLWDYTYKALWSETPRNPPVNLDLSLEDLNERTFFLTRLDIVPKDELRGLRGKICSFLKELCKIPHRSAIRR